MLKPARMEKIVRSMSSVLGCPLTIKVPSTLGCLPDPPCVQFAWCLLIGVC